MRSLAPAFSAAGSKHSAMTAMLPWLQRSAFPIVTLSIAPSPSQSGAYVLTAAQKCVSQYALGAEQPWWIPLRVSIGGGPLLTFELDAITMNFDIPAVSLGAEHIEGSDVPTISGDPEFWGAFAVRYADPVQWSSRMASYASGALPREYQRAFATHAMLLSSTAGHERIDAVAAKLIAASTQLLANMTCIGGYAGSGDQYANLLKRATPMYSLLTGGAAPSAALASAIQRLVAPLVKRVGWSDATMPLPSPSACHPFAFPKEANGVPWPTHEDPGMEQRAITALRSTALATAVLFNDPSTVVEALDLFRNSTTFVIDGPGARAAYISAARYGTDEDASNLVAALNVLLGDGDKQSQSQPPPSPPTPNQGAVATLVNAFAAGAAVEARCAAAIGGIARASAAKGVGFSQTDALGALAELLSYAPSAACRTAAWSSAVAAATAAWATIKADASKSALAVLTLAASRAEQASAGALIAEQATRKTISADAAHAAVVKIQTNLDVVAFNK